MENGEIFFLEFSSDGGQTYPVRVKLWEIRSGSAFHYDVLYQQLVDFTVNAVSGLSYELTQYARIRFICDASGNGDQIFLDAVKFEGYGPLSS